MPIVLNVQANKKSSHYQIGNREWVVCYELDLLGICLFLSHIRQIIESKPWKAQKIWKYESSPIIYANITHKTLQLSIIN